VIPTTYAAQQPRTQVSAMTGMLAAIVVLVAALTHGQTLTHSAIAAGAGYGVVLVAAVLRLQVQPLAFLLSTVRITLALAQGLAQLRHHNRRTDREVWA